MTVNEIFSFAGELMSKGYVQKKLSQYCEINGQGHSSHYILKSVYIKDNIDENSYDTRYESDITPKIQRTRMFKEYK